MSCERFATAIADHACGADLAPDVAAHVASCVGCASQLARQRRTIQGLDAELQQMLAIEPSPFFAQRVQALVTTAPAKPSVRAWLWMAAAAAAAIVLAVLLLTTTRPRPAATAVDARTALPAPATVIERPAPVVVEESTPPVKRSTPTNTRAKQPAVIAAEPEVLVPRDQMRAVARYMALMRSGTLDAANLVANAAATQTPAEMVIGPLEVNPIAVSDVDSVTTPVVERRHE